MKIDTSFISRQMKKVSKMMDDTFTEMGKIFDSTESGGVSIQNSNGTTVINKNGHLVVKGKFKSITINGRKINNIKEFS